MAARRGSMPARILKRDGAGWEASGAWEPSSVFTSVVYVRMVV